MRSSFVEIASLACLGLICTSTADAQNNAGRLPLAKELAPAKIGGRLSVTSGEFVSGGVLDQRYTKDGENVSPPVSWTKGPRGTLSYAIIFEDAGAKSGEPVTHWIVYDLSSSRSGLAENQPASAQIGRYAVQGLNDDKSAGFSGPNPPAGETRPYHIQVFALNTRLKLDPGQADRDDVVKAMRGHVLALGDLVVNYTGK